MVIGFYLIIFNNGISTKNEDWGTFGDYIGGVINPLIAACALYLISETYKLQKLELKKTVELLNLSTVTQENQMQIAALTALININLIIINELKDKSLELSKFKEINPNNIHAMRYMKNEEFMLNKFEFKKVKTNINNIENEIKNLQLENDVYRGKIKAFIL